MTPDVLLVSQELAASSLAPMELCGTQRSSETMLTYSEHREYRSLLGKLQWLRPELSYEVNRAAQRSSAPTVADARALNAISLKAQRSSETILRSPRGVINVSSAQLVTYGDAFSANMEGSKSQCGVIVFLTHEPRRFWHGESQLGHLVHWTSSTINRVVRSTLAAEAYSVSEAVEEAQWLRSVLAGVWPSVPTSLPRSLRTVEMDSLRRPIVTLSGSFNLCQTVKSDKGTGSDKRLRIVTAMLRQVFCGAQGATLASVTTATMLADALTKALSFVACCDERTPPRVRDFRFQHRCEDNLADALRACANPHNGKWISADSVSRIALWKVWSVHWLRRPMVTYSLLDTRDAEALFCVSGFSGHVERFVSRCSLNSLENAVSEIGIFVPSTNVCNIITVGHMKRI